jgi:hypothetical protein
MRVMAKLGRYHARVLYSGRIAIDGRRCRLEEALRGRERYVLYGKSYPSATMMNFLRMIVKHRRIVPRGFSRARSPLRKPRRKPV